MAKYCKLSVGYFSHIFKERMDAAPMHYLNDLRIEKAKELISTNTMKLSDVTSMVGFSDSLYFSRVFKRLPEFLQRIPAVFTYREHSELVARQIAGSQFTDIIFSCTIEPV